MCKKAKNKKGFFKRFVIWLAWHFLRPDCEGCNERDTCAYNALMSKKEG